MIPACWKRSPLARLYYAEASACDGDAWYWRANAGKKRGSFSNVNVIGGNVCPPAVYFYSEGKRCFNASLMLPIILPLLCCLLNILFRYSIIQLKCLLTSVDLLLALLAEQARDLLAPSRLLVPSLGASAR